MWTSSCCGLICSQQKHPRRIEPHKLIIQRQQMIRYDQKTRSYQNIQLVTKPRLLADGSWVLLLEHHYRTISGNQVLPLPWKVNGGTMWCQCDVKYWPHKVVYISGTARPLSAISPYMAAGQHSEHTGHIVSATFAKRQEHWWQPAINPELPPGAAAGSMISRSRRNFWRTGWLD